MGSNMDGIILANSCWPEHGRNYRIGSNIDGIVLAKMDACKIGRNYFCQDGCSRKHIETNIDGAILDRCSQNHIGSNMDGIILAKMDSYKPYLLAPLHGCGSPSCGSQIERSTPETVKIKCVILGWDCSGAAFIGYEVRTIDLMIRSMLVRTTLPNMLISIPFGF